MSDAPSPSEAVELSSDTAEGAADAAAEHAAAEGASESVDADDMGGSSTSIKDALLHTEPRIRPAAAKDELGVDDTGAHAYIGIRKFVAGLGVGSDESGGTPAVIHFATAGWHAFGPGGESQEQTDDDDTDAAAALGGTGESESEPEINDPATAGGA